MNIIKKIKNYISKKKETIDILYSLIESIEEKEGTVFIKTNKNIAIENNGHFVLVNKGMSVNISKEIHLNPNININKDNFLNLEYNLEEAQKIAYEEAKNAMAINTLKEANKWKPLGS
jgi:hypothetical protein